MTSTLSKRQPLPHYLEDYVLNYEKSSSAGLFPVDSSTMSYIPGLAGESGAVDQSTVIDIGFTFNFDSPQIDSINISADSRFEISTLQL